jgi:beta-phosphoglucomutase-like phosphatase (HAD superfamily)
MKAVIFDCDGVLVDSEIIALRVELKALADIGLHYDDAHAFAERFLGQTHAAFHAELDKDHRERLGAPLPEGFGPRLIDMIWAEMSEFTEAVPGVHQAVADLTVPVAVASSSGLEHIKHKLRRAALFEAFDPHIYSGELGAARHRSRRLRRGGRQHQRCKVGGGGRNDRHRFRRRRSLLTAPG